MGILALIPYSKNNPGLSRVRYLSCIFAKPFFKLEEGQEDIFLRPVRIGRAAGVLCHIGFPF
jgi:hypothetical protein